MTDSDEHTRPRILVTYASGYGATQGVADFIGDVLRETATVEVHPVRDAPDPGSFDAVIVGSAIQYSRWMPDARRFITTHQDALGRVPVAYFFTCLALSHPNDDTRRQAQGYAEQVRALAPAVTPVGIGQFAGVLRYAGMSLVHRTLLRIAILFKRVSEGDYRDWDAIRAWTTQTRRRLDREPAARPHRRGS